MRSREEMAGRGLRLTTRHQKGTVILRVSRVVMVSVYCWLAGEGVLSCALLSAHSAATPLPSAVVPSDPTQLAVVCGSIRRALRLLRPLCTVQCPVDTTALSRSSGGSVRFGPSSIVSRSVRRRVAPCPLSCTVAVDGGWDTIRSNPIRSTTVPSRPQRRGVTLDR
jgi:hypothetical protein